MKNKLIGCFFTACLLIGVAYALVAGIGSREKPVSEAAPPFTLTDMAGTDVSLEDARGEVLVVNFWATYCKPCKEELPLFESVYHSYKERGVKMAAINVSEPEKFVSGFLSKTKVSFPVLLDRYGEVTESYGVTTLPATFLIGEDGRILKEVKGALSEDMLEDMIDGALELEALITANEEGPRGVPLGPGIR